MRRWSIALVLVALLPAAGRAQTPWRLTAEVGGTGFTEAFHDSSTPTISAGAWRPRMYTLRLTGRLAGVGVGLGASLAKSGMGGGDGSSFVLIFTDQLVLFELAPEVRIPLGRGASGVELLAHAGPVWDHWSLSGEPGRSRLGGQAGMTLSFPLGGAWRTDLRADVAISGSFVNDDETGPDVRRPGSMRRHRLALGISRRL